MPIFVGGTEITDIKIGNTEINEVYVGANKVWERSLATYTMVAGSYFNRHSYSDQGGTTTYQDTYMRGFKTGTPSFGSLSPTTFSLSGGNPSIVMLRDYRLHTWNSGGHGHGGSYQDHSKFTVNGNVGNSGWTTITVNGVTKTRASASHSQSGGQTTWQWSDRWLPSSGTHDVIFN